MNIFETYRITEKTSLEIILNNINDFCKTLGYKIVPNKAEDLSVFIIKNIDGHPAAIAKKTPIISNIQTNDNMIKTLLEKEPGVELVRQSLRLTNSTLI